MVVSITQNGSFGLSESLDGKREGAVVGSIVVGDGDLGTGGNIVEGVGWVVGDGDGAGERGAFTGGQPGNTSKIVGDFQGGDGVFSAICKGKNLTLGGLSHHDWAKVVSGRGRGEGGG